MSTLLLIIAALDDAVLSKDCTGVNGTTPCYSSRLPQDKCCPRCRALNVLDDLRGALIDIQTEARNQLLK